MVPSGTAPVTLYSTCGGQHWQQSLPDPGHTFITSPNLPLRPSFLSWLTTPASSLHTGRGDMSRKPPRSPAASHQLTPPLLLCPHLCPGSPSDWGTPLQTCLVCGWYLLPCVQVYTVLYLTLPDATLTPRTGNSVLITPLLQVLQQAVRIGHQVQTGTCPFIVRSCASHLASPCGFCKEPRESPCCWVPTGPGTTVLAHLFLLFLLYALKSLL